MSSQTPPRAPRWVKVSAIAVAILVLAFLIAQVFGIGGPHGPGRHASLPQPPNTPPPPAPALASTPAATS
ncbi:hypothetical protein [Nonomuraea typhae]|uniref:hypothetical protein n=1 Tax=Nonomuraea typhae TaxID=2603600 RepID=UPI0012FC0384|nr:hypothetical protein [Nonomuraea typhae]